jgi:hypothetical protein
MSLFFPDRQKLLPRGYSRSRPLTLLNRQMDTVELRDPFISEKRSHHEAQHVLRRVCG